MAKYIYEDDVIKSYWQIFWAICYAEIRQPPVTIDKHQQLLYANNNIDAN